jgi:transcription elongation factor Elf1
MLVRANSTLSCTGVTMSEFTTVPLRCPACGQQTHKTLESVVQEGGFLCECGARNELDIERFAEEIKKSESAVKDFSRRG